MSKDEYGVEVYLEDVDISAIAITSGLGACSLMNESFLLKSADKKKKTLSKEEVDILKEIGEYDELIEQGIIVEKSNKQDDTSEGETMSEEVVKSLEAKIELLEKQLKVSDATNIIKSFGFENESEVANVLAKLDVEEQKIITCLFKTLVDAKEEAIKKSKEDKMTPFDKALAKDLEEDIPDPEDIIKQQDQDIVPVKKGFVEERKAHKAAQKANK